MTLSEYLYKYREQFDANFPIFGFMAMSEDVIIKAIKKCLDENKPYELDVKDGTYY